MTPACVLKTLQDLLHKAGLECLLLAQRVVLHELAKLLPTQARRVFALFEGFLNFDVALVLIASSLVIVRTDVIKPLYEGVAKAAQGCSLTALATGVERVYFAIEGNLNLIECAHVWSHLAGG